MPQVVAYEKLNTMENDKAIQPKNWSRLLTMREVVQYGGLTVITALPSPSASLLRAANAFGVTWFVSGMSPKCIDREGQERRRTASTLPFMGGRRVMN